MPSAGEVYQIAQTFSLLSGDTALNIFDFVVGSGNCTDAELLTAMATWIDSAYTELIADIHSSVDMQEGRVSQMLWSATEWVVLRYVGNIYPTTTFIGGGEALPNQTSALVKFPTYTPRVSGKKYLPPFGELAQSAGGIVASAVANMVDFADFVRTPWGAGSATLQYVIRRKNGATATPYASEADAVLSSQRKRKPFVGI